MKCILSGSSGFIGKRLVESLLAAGHYVAAWSRKPGTERRNAVGSFYWDLTKGEPAEESINDFDAVIHLAGEPVSQRWTDGAKRAIRESRVVSTRNLVKALAKATRRPSVLVCASATGYYGPRGDELVDETSAPGSDFLAEVCVEWEREADRAIALGMRVVKVRTGVVLGTDGGALKAMLPAFEAYAGGRLGSGKQWMSWIHIDDIVGLYRLAIEGAVSGAMDGTAPHPVTNQQFTDELGKALGKPALLRVPEFALKLLMGEMSEMVLTGQRVLPKVAEAAGYEWKFPQLGGALEALHLR